MPELEDETVEQLQEMLELLDRYPGITDSAAFRIGAWAEGTLLPSDSTFSKATRKEQAGILIQWFKDMLEKYGN